MHGCYFGVSLPCLTVCTPSCTVWFLRRCEQSPCLCCAHVCAFPTVPRAHKSSSPSHSPLSSHRRVTLLLGSCHTPPHCVCATMHRALLSLCGYVQVSQSLLSRPLHLCIPDSTALANQSLSPPSLRFLAPTNTRGCCWAVLLSHITVRAPHVFTLNSARVRMCERGRVCSIACKWACEERVRILCVSPPHR